MNQPRVVSTDSPPATQGEEMIRVDNAEEMVEVVRLLQTQGLTFVAERKSGTWEITLT